MNPNHVALIPDGFRRWASQNGVPQEDGYKVVMRTLPSIIDVIFEEGVKYLSVYVLSKENLSREEQTLNITLRGQIQIFTHTLPSIAHKWQCRIIHVGDPSILPNKYTEALQFLTESTAHYSERIVYLCAGYNPKDEIIQAVSNALLTSSTIWQSLWVPEDVDLVIRTSGERRTSNLLPIQIAYAELHFIDKNFPDITPDDIKVAFAEYHARARRLGL